jgi:hypothetical protein
MGQSTDPLYLNGKVVYREYHELLVLLFAFSHHTDISVSESLGLCSPSLTPSSLRTGPGTALIPLVYSHTGTRT